MRPEEHDNRSKNQRTQDNLAPIYTKTGKNPRRTKSAALALA
jgi:hypothetical protein